MLSKKKISKYSCTSLEQFSVMAAAADLVHLIDLSLGVQPSGVVNFNSLHGLMHEIVRRLVQMEELQAMSAPSMVQFETRQWSPAHGADETADPVVDGSKEKSSHPAASTADRGEKKEEPAETEGEQAQSPASGTALSGEGKVQLSPHAAKVKPSPSHATSGSSVSRPVSHTPSSVCTCH